MCNLQPALRSCSKSSRIRGNRLHPSSFYEDEAQGSRTIRVNPYSQIAFLREVKSRKNRPAAALLRPP